jgi:hypothetical protein
MSHIIAYYVLAGIFGGWCAVATGFASDGEVGPMVITVSVYTVGTIALCVYALLGGPS